jgi:hypothetical protein
MLLLEPARAFGLGSEAEQKCLKRAGVVKGVRPEDSDSDRS